MALADHAGQDGFGHDERPDEVDVDDLTEIFRAHLTHGDALDNACIIDENVDRAQGFRNFSHHGPDRCFIGHITEIAVRRNAFLFIIRESLLQMHLAAAVESNDCTGFRKRLGNSKTDTVRTACDKGGFSL